MNKKGRNGDLISSIEVDDLISISPRFDFTEIFCSSVLLEVIVTLLFIEHIIAFIPKTTKCSPNKITFAGADAIDFK